MSRESFGQYISRTRPRLAKHQRHGCEIARGHRPPAVAPAMAGRDHDEQFVGKEVLSLRLNLGLGFRSFFELQFGSLDSYLAHLLEDAS